MIRRAMALFLVALVALAGCSTTIDAADYDQSCNADTDCRVIHVGDTCDCACNNAAINVADYPQYVDDRGSPSCSVDCGPCPAVTAACAAGRCVAQ